MYQYNEIDQRLVDDRVAVFRKQIERFLGGRLSEDDFRPLHLQNGLYSNPPRDGARSIAHILLDGELETMWQLDVAAMRQRISPNFPR